MNIDEFKEQDVSHEDIEHVIIPRFLTEGFDVFTYLKCFIKLLKIILNENNSNNIVYSKEFQLYLTDLIHYSKKCKQSAKFMYDIVFASINDICLVNKYDNWNAIVEKLINTDEKKRILVNIQLLSKTIPSLIKIENDYRKITSNYSFQSYFDMVLINLRKMYSSLLNCSYNLFTLLEYKSPKENYEDFFNLLHGQQKHEKDHQKIYNSITYLKFLYVKRSFNEFISKYFDDFNISYYQDENMKNLLMPGAFYEYMLLQDIETKESLKFHSSIQNPIINFNDFSLINAEGNVQNYEYLFDIVSQLQTNGELIRFYPDFEIVCSSMHTNDSKLFFCCSIDTEVTKIMRYHEKNIGNACKGFWIEFNGRKYFFKELYCNTQLYKEQMFKVISNPETILAHGLTMQRDSFRYVAEETVPTKKSHEINIDDSVFYYVNQYIELSGYFLLSALGKIPRVDAYFSVILGNPIIKVDGLDEKFKLVKSINTRMTFDQVIDDFYSIFISSIQIQGLRLIQIIFLLDDFHEENVAVSFETKMFDNVIIEYINEIKVIDLWPTISKLEDIYLFRPTDKSVFCETCSFDDLIITKLLHIKGLMKSLSMDNVIGEYSSKVKAPEDKIETKEKLSIITQFDVNTKKEIYGERILDFPTLGVKKDPFYVTAYFAMMDLFDSIYYSNVEKYSKYKSNYCVNIAMDLLAESYGRTTQTLPKIANNENEVMWNKYLNHVSSCIESIIESLGAIIDYDMINSKNAQRIELIIQEGKNDYEIKNCKAQLLFSDIHKRYKYVGMILSKNYREGDFIKYMKEFNYQQIVTDSKKITDFIPHLYIIESPVMFDIAKAKLQDANFSDYQNVYCIQ